MRSKEHISKRVLRMLKHDPPADLSERARTVAHYQNEHKVKELELISACRVAFLQVSACCAVKCQPGHFATFVICVLLAC